MDKNVFKNLFDEIAQSNGFEKAFNMWFKEQNESLVSIDLQRSNFSALYYVNINIYIQGVWGKNFKKSKDLKFGSGGAVIFRQTPKEYDEALNLENSFTDLKRRELLQKMFSDFIIPFVEKTSTKEGIRKTYTDNSYFLLPAVRQELGIPLEDS